MILWSLWTNQNSVSYPVIDAGEDSLEESELGVDAEEEEHEEEHDCEELRDRERRERVGVRDEGETLAPADEVFQWDPSLLALGAEDGEHEDGGDDGGDEVEAGDDGGGDVDPVLELVVAPEHEEAAPGDREREEHLARSLSPHLSIKYLLLGFTEPTNVL